MKNKIIIFGIILIICILVYSTNNEYKYDNSIESNKIIAYVNGKRTGDIPGKNDGYSVDKVECTNNATGTWNYSSWGLLITDIEDSDTRCSVYFSSSRYYLFKNGASGSTWSKAGTYQYSQGLLQEYTVSIGNTISLHSKGPNISQGYITSDSAIDLTNYSKLVIKGDYNITNVGARFFMINVRAEQYGKQEDVSALYNTGQNMDKLNGRNFIGQLVYNINDICDSQPFSDTDCLNIIVNSPNDNFTFERDISKASGKYYIMPTIQNGPNNHTNNVNISEIYLEK